MDLSTFVTASATLVTFAFVYYNIKVFTFWSSRGIKGPQPWPILGTSIYYFFKNKHELEEEWRHKYGRIYGCYEGYVPILKATDANLNKHVFIKEFSSFTDRNNMWIFHPVMSHWVFFTKGRHWANQRALITPMFSAAKFRSMFPNIIDRVDHFVDKVKELASEDKKGALVTRHYLMAAALDVVATNIFGIKLDCYRDKMSDFAKRAFAFASFDVPRSIVWFMMPTFIAKMLKFDQVSYDKFEYFDKLTVKTVEERRKGKSKAGVDFVQALLDADISNKSERVYTEEDNQTSHFNDHISHQELQRTYDEQAKNVQFRKFDDLEIRGQATFFFLAGFETTSNTLAFCLYELAHQTKIQEELYEELVGIQAQCKDRNLEYSDISNLKKLDAFISEAMRLYSIVTEFNRIVTAKEGVVLPTNPPLALPQGTVISVPAFSVQRDPEYWPEPDKFDITRFYPENKAKILSGTYMPFGLGPRNCAGMRFALLTVKLMLAKTLLNFQVTPGERSKAYPPKFVRHMFFLSLRDTDFVLSPRSS